jgi:integrase
LVPVWYPRGCVVRGALLVVERDGGPVYNAKWRDGGGRQVKRRVGPAWLVRDGSAWRPRRGRVPAGSFDERAAVVLMASVIEAHEEELRVSAPSRRSTFADAAALWQHHLEHVKGVKPSTLDDYRYLLAPPGAPARKRGKKPAARIMRAFGDRPLASITVGDVARYLSGLDDDPTVAARTVNKHRQVLSSVFEHAMREDTFGLAVNPARSADKRREPDARPIDFYEAEEVLALARAARAGLHRDPGGRRSRTPSESTASAATSRTPRCSSSLPSPGCGWASCSRCAGATSTSRTRSCSSRRAGRRAGSPRRSRANGARSRSPISRRRCSPSSRRASASPAARTSRSATRSGPTSTPRRSAAATATPKRPPAAGLRPLRFHDLRHSFGSLVIREFDPASVKAFMGHAKITTTERYLHARPRRTDAARMTKAFGSEVAERESEPAA